MSLFKVLMILLLGVYSKASLSESDKECEGNIPCELKAPDSPQEEINSSHHQRRRRYLSNPCESITEELPFRNIDPDAPPTLLKELLTQKIKQTRCAEEGAKCLQYLSSIEGRSLICQTKTTSRMYEVKTEEKIEVYGEVNVGCDCVYE